MSIKCLNLETSLLENVDLDIDTVMDCINNSRSKCLSYTPYTYYDVDDSSRHLLVKIDNRTKNIESFTSANAKDLWYNVNGTEDLRTSRIKNIIPNIRYRFNVRASVSKFMFSYNNGDDELNLVESNLPIVNTLRSTVYENKKFPRKVLMWEFIRIDELAKNCVIKVNFVTNELEDVLDTEISDILGMNSAGKELEKFRSHFREVSGYSSDGREKPTNDFDFISTSNSNIQIRSTSYKDNYILVKDRILCNDDVAMGVDTHKAVSAVFMRRFISRIVMVFKHTDIIPCFSIINFKEFFGFYPIWYLHPDVTIYGSDSMEGLLSLLDLIDGEEVYDSEEEVKDLWKYFIPYYMSDDWEYYVDLVAKEKSKLSGYSKGISADLINEKDFIEYLLVHKLTERPRQLTNRNKSTDFYRPLDFEPGVVPDKYKLAVNGYRCNMYLFKQGGKYIIRDCVNMCNIPLESLGDSYRDNFFKKMCDILIKHQLVFEELSPVLYICDKGNYIIKMSQIGCMTLEEKDNGKFLLQPPIEVTSDVYSRIQVKKFDCHTKTDEDYKLNHVGSELPSLVEKAMYRSKGLDGFVEPSKKDIELFGTRRKPVFDDPTSQALARKWGDLRDVHNLYLGSNIMQWVKMGARGTSSLASMLADADWDRVIWYCPFNTWFASIEMPMTKFDWSGTDDLKVVMNNIYNSDYYYQVEDFYSWKDVCMIKARIPGKPWRLVADCYPLEFIDLSDLSRTSQVNYEVYDRSKGNGVFGLALDESDILFRSKEFILVSTEGHKYLIGARNSDGVYAVENIIIDSLDGTLLNSIKNVEDVTYRNGIWKLLQSSDFSRIEEIYDNLYYVENPRLPYGAKVSDADLRNPVTIQEKFYVYIDSILYIFRLDDKIESITRISDLELKVNDNLYVWSSRIREFIKQEEIEMDNYTVIEQPIEEVENVKIADTETTSFFGDSPAVEQDKEECNNSKEYESQDDWLYDFGDGYFNG